MAGGRAWAIASIVLGVAAPGIAAAHTNTRAYLDVTARGRTVTLRLRGTFRDLSPLLEVAPMVRPTSELYRARRDAILRDVAASISVYDGATNRCTPRDRSMTLGDGTLAIELALRCPYGELELRYDLIFDSDPAHRAFVTVHDAHRRRSLVLLDSGHRTLRLERRHGTTSLLATFSTLGLRHILTGYDHILFVVALLLATPLAGRRPERRRPLWTLIETVTGFTVGHSVTLALAALGWVEPASRIVEPAIALSVAYVAAENLVVDDARHRWWIALAFGLVHGFGFAGILRTAGLPQSGGAIALAAFNGGVELGQLVVVALLYPVLTQLTRPLTLGGAAIAAALLAALCGAVLSAGVAPGVWIAAPVLALGLVPLAHRRGYRAAMRLASAAILALALLWLVERALSLEIASGLFG